MPASGLEPRARQNPVAAHARKADTNTRDTISPMPAPSAGIGYRLPQAPPTSALIEIAPIPLQNPVRLHKAAWAYLLANLMPRRQISSRPLMLLLE